MKITNPTTNTLIKEIDEDNTSTVIQKYNTLKSNKSNFKKSTLEERINIIKNFSKLLNENIDRLAQILTSEMGKPLQESKNEINGAIYRIEYFIHNSMEWLTDKEVFDDGNTKEILTYQPLGVVLNISAWNYPYLVGMNVIIPAIIGGNCVIYKPSEHSSLTGIEITKLLYLSGLSKDYFQCVIGGGNIGKELLKLKFDGVFFTGSYNTGKSIYESATKEFIPIGLELGGKDPCYVTSSIDDIRSVSESVCEGAFYNNGQSCCSVERIYVHQDIYDDFIANVKLIIGNYKIGNPKEDVNCGAITRADHINFLNSQKQDALDKGAKILIENKNIPSVGNFFSPTVLIDVNHNMNLMKDETFGPLIGIQKVKDDQEAIQLMNDSEFGLTASVFSNDKKRAKTILDNLEAGNVYINCCDRVSPYLPWAGQRNSGIGQTLSFNGILGFVRPKSFHIR